jgi:putative peptidoglycan lipid II flippase
LQAALIPAITAQYRKSRHRELGDALASTVLAWGTALLAVVVALGFLAREPILEFTIGRIADSSTRADAISLGGFMWWFFLPQIVLYLANAVCTAVLNAQGHFSVPAVSPLINNVVVIATYVLFDALRHGAAPSLDLTVAQKSVLAGGTTLGVLAFCAAPVVAAVAGGFRFHRPWALSDPRVTEFGRQAGWAVAYIGVNQLVFLMIMRSANSGAGTFSVWQTAWQIFLLPHAVLTVPILTTRFPALTLAAQGEEWGRVAEIADTGFRSIAAVAALAAAALFALSEPIARMISLSGAAGGPGPLADAVAGFAPGLVGFGLFLFLTRVAYATGDVRRPVIANLVASVLGGVALVGPLSLRTRWTAGELALAYSVIQLLATALMWWFLWHGQGGFRLRGSQLWASLLVRLAAAAAAAFPALWAVSGLYHGTVASAAVAGAVGAALVFGIWILVSTLLVGADPRTFLASLGGVAGRFDAADRTHGDPNRGGAS